MLKLIIIIGLITTYFGIIGTCVYTEALRMDYSSDRNFLFKIKKGISIVLIAFGAVTAAIATILKIFGEG